MTVRKTLELGLPGSNILVPFGFMFNDRQLSGRDIELTGTSPIGRTKDGLFTHLLLPDFASAASRMDSIRSVCPILICTESPELDTEWDFDKPYYTIAPLYSYQRGIEVTNGSLHFFFLVDWWSTNPMTLFQRKNTKEDSREEIKGFELKITKSKEEPESPPFEESAPEQSEDRTENEELRASRERVEGIL